MPILEPEEYSEYVERAVEKNIEKPLEAGEGEEVIYFSAFTSRDALHEIADDICLSDFAWHENFKYNEEFEFEAVVDMKTGVLVKLRLI